MELSKMGYLSPYEPYNGFYDTFNKNNKKHIHTVQGISVEDSPTDGSNTSIILSEEDYNNFNIDDYMIIASKNFGKSVLVKVIEKNDTDKLLRFSPQTPFNVLEGDAVLYKHRGSIVDNSFMFGEVIPIKAGTKELYTSLDDDTHWSTRTIKRNNTGYAYTFRIPTSYQRNYLSKMTLKVKKVGNPGPLKAYIINEKNVSKWKNPVDAHENGFLIAESKTLTVDSKLDLHLVEFEFIDPAKKISSTRTTTLVSSESKSKIDSNSSNYPLLKEYDNEHGSNVKVRYCLIVECTEDTNDNNFYEIVFLGNSDNASKDLQLNNTVYEYSVKSSSSPDMALTTNQTINNLDLYYGITLIEAVKEDFTVYDKGLYKAKFKCNKDEATKVRLAMRIGREGLFHITSDAGIKGSGDFADNSTIVITGEESFDISGFDNINDKPVVIGTEIRKITNVNNNNLTIDKGLHIEPNDIIYPVGYKVFINCKKTKWNKETCTTDILDKGRYELPLKEVLRDSYKKDLTISDRLIFEANFLNEDRDKLKAFNDFELEIYWEKSSKDLNPKMVGYIKDLSLSLTNEIL